MLCGIPPRQLMIRQRILGRSSRARCVRKLSGAANPEAPAVVPASLRYLRYVTFEPWKGNIPSCSATMLLEGVIIMRVPHARFIFRSPSNAHGDVLRGQQPQRGAGVSSCPIHRRAQSTIGNASRGTVVQQLQIGFVGERSE